MSRTPLLSLGPDVRRGGGPLRRLMLVLRALRRDTHACRARRVVLLIISLWAINLADLALTIWARDIGGFHEANPLAQPLVGSTVGLVIFKLSMVSLSSLILLTYRRRVLTELGCWVLLTAYTGLCFIWMQYFSYDLSGPL